MIDYFSFTTIVADCMLYAIALMPTITESPSIRPSLAVFALSSEPALFTTITDAAAIVAYSKIVLVLSSVMI